MSRFEKDLLIQVLRKDQRRRGDASQGLTQGQGGHPSCFVWTGAELQSLGALTAHLMPPTSGGPTRPQMWTRFRTYWTRTGQRAN